MKNERLTCGIITSKRTVLLEFQSSNNQFLESTKNGDYKVWSLGSRIAYRFGMVKKPETQSFEDLNKVRQSSGVIHVIMCVFDRPEMIPKIMSDLREQKLGNWRLEMHVCLNNRKLKPIMDRYMHVENIFIKLSCSLVLKRINFLKLKFLYLLILHPISGDKQTGVC